LGTGAVSTASSKITIEVVAGAELDTEMPEPEKDDFADEEEEEELYK
jgi:hypothetical protein